ncbi:MAG: hypothetical protein SFZ24_08615 [Planctomycetota bacterium]|nr:hypothetical protein [Planctomycetota bacterium]
MLEKLKAGQTIRCTIERAARTEDDQQTIMRLMRNDPKFKRELKSAQEHRVRTLLIVSRGKRPWEVRERSSKLVRPVKGATWTMRYYPQIANDFASVSRFLKIEAA